MDKTVIDSYPRYDSYKETSEEWIGKIPTTWDSVPLRNIFKFRNEKNDPIITDEILSLSIAHGVTKYSDKNRGGNKRKDDITAYKIARPNDIVLNSMNIIVGAVGLSKYFGAISPVYYALYLHSNEASINYYEWVFHNESFQKSLLKYGKGILIKMGEGGKMNTIRMKISQHDMKYFILPCPPLSDQEKIAKFLVKKTTQIDQAITLKQQQIAKLEEYKQIVIQNAVTKGLNPDAPMKDSGVDWIGEIPEHWEIRKLKFISRINKSTLSEKTDSNLEIKYVDIGSVTFEDGVVSIEAFNFSNAPSRARRVAKNHDTIISTVRTYLKAIDYIDNEKSNYIYSTGFAVLTPNQQIKPKFLTFFVWSNAFTNQVRDFSKGVSYPAINSSDLGNLFISLPPHEEQKEIIEYINSMSRQINSSINNIKLGINRLKEYKTILINQAVTGKIKVS